jgi:hypothetical protein
LAQTLCCLSQNDAWRRYGGFGRKVEDSKEKASIMLRAK